MSPSTGVRLLLEIGETNSCTSIVGLYTRQIMTFHKNYTTHSSM